MWATPIPQLVLALEAKVEFLSMTNPFGAKPQKRKSEKGQSEAAAKAKLALVALKRQELRARNK